MQNRIAFHFTLTSLLLIFNQRTVTPLLIRLIQFDEIFKESFTAGFSRKIDTLPQDHKSYFFCIFLEEVKRLDVQINQCNFYVCVIDTKSI